jgi:two-component system, NtrC family, response regulator GlrR
VRPFLTAPTPFKEAKEDFERDYLTMILRATGGNVSKAARLAGWRRVDFYGLPGRHDLKAGSPGKK